MGRWLVAVPLLLLAAAVPATGAGSSGKHVHRGPNGETDVTVCADAPAGRAQCLSNERTDDVALSNRPARPGVARHASSVGNNGAYDPYFLRSAYSVPAGGSGRTVAIVDAYDDPNAYADMTYYRSFFQLPPCTVESGCFQKVDQRGGAAYPRADTGWAGEIALDIEMVSAICPSCNIVLVEANSNALNDLAAAANTAVNVFHADAVSNSYGTREWSGQASLSSGPYNHPGVAITAATGDTGYGLWFPASSRNVVAVGGTSLFQNSATGTRDATETAWAGAGSGCSAYETKMSWQSDTGCAKRAAGDVSAVADPATGVWVYDTYGRTGWRILGGTSVASPIVGAMYAVAGGAAAGDNLASYPYGNAESFNDVDSGSNGTCAVAYLCTSGAGYDGPTGVGTPNGAAGFARPAPIAPDAPLGVSAAAVAGGVSVSWQRPAFDGWSAIGAYTVTASPGGASATVSGTAATLTNLVSGATYTFTVRAVNETGAGPSSAPSNAVVNGTWKRVDDGSPSIAYRGSWTRIGSSATYQGAYRRSVVTASTATFAFTGTGVRWIGIPAPDGGLAEVRLDGALVATVDQYAAASRPLSVMIERTGLASKPHTLEVRVTGKKNASSSGIAVRVDAFDLFS